jgi:hypothetical protein
MASSLITACLPSLVFEELNEGITSFLLGVLNLLCSIEALSLAPKV